MRGDTFSAFPFVEEFATVVPNLIMKDELSGANNGIDTGGLLFLIGDCGEKIRERCWDKAFSQHVKGHIATGTMATNYSFIKFKKRNSTCKFCLMYIETYLVIVQVLRLVRRLR